jgi:DUF1009 family protein
MNEKRTIGLIAGGRQFPVLVARGARREGHRVITAGFPGHVDHEQELAEHSDVFELIKLGKLAKLFKFFKKHNVQDVVMAGTINKPKIMDVRHFDLKAIRLIFSQPSKGDSILLGALTRAFEAEGMRVVPPHQFLPELVTPEGVLTKRAPTEREWADLRFGYKVAKAMGELDVGQCIVLRERIVAAVEALEGTDNCIRRGLEFGGPESVVIKVFKPGQEERVDLPCAGSDTIATIAAGKGTVLGMEAGKSLLFDADAAIDAANRVGITIVGVTADMLQDSPVE